MNVYIVLPFEGAEKRVPVWANEEVKIDFRIEVKNAARCTAAFAAMELKHYLSRTIFDAEIKFSKNKPQNEFFIIFKINDFTSQSEEFVLKPCNNGLILDSKGRIGLLYGVYEILNMQGWRWYAPGKNGEIAPEMKNELVLPKMRHEYKASMDSGRGFDFEFTSMESAELLIWMCRNRLNVSMYRPATIHLAKKLGMTLKIGGHIFEDLLNPDKCTPSGKTLWEEHEDWYGLPFNGCRRKETALHVQFCVTRKDLLEFLADDLLCRLTTVWKDADRIDLWGFDTWGATCNCSKCKNLGNGTDKTLFFLSYIREFINKAIEEGKLDHYVNLVMCSYEGTSSISGPQNPIPQNLIDANDIITFYPINRCYAHNFNDRLCETNSFYKNALNSFLKKSASFKIVIGEYYNVSKFEDLPLLFFHRMIDDIPAFYMSGVRGITYMHIPLVNWGMRTLTQVLYAQLAWNIKTDTQIFINEYFDNWYGPFADDMRIAYDLIEKAWTYISDWRAWKKQSILTQLISWDGKKPKNPFEFEQNHLSTMKNAIKSGHKSIKQMREADKIIGKAKKRCYFENFAERNNVKMDDMNSVKCYEMRLGEDKRLLRYGIDTMIIMTEMIAYYYSLFTDTLIKSEKIWKRIENAAESLDSYYIPISYEWPGPGLVSLDGLTRTQLRYLLHRCRKQRIQKS